MNTRPVINELDLRLAYEAGRLQSTSTRYSHPDREMSWCLSHTVESVEDAVRDFHKGDYKYRIALPPIVDEGASNIIDAS
jgi:hypothetical protein